MNYKNFLNILILLLLFIKPSFGELHRTYYAEGMNGAISCGHPLAANTAIKILKDGGNAVDAAVAAAFVLGVVDFSNSGLGGDGFALIYHPSGKVIAIDGSTRRPLNRLTNDYNCLISLPTIPEMLLKMRRFYGNLNLRKLIQPSIDICYKGFKITPYLSNIIKNNLNKLHDPNTLKLIAPSGKALEIGHILKQTELGKTLEQISYDDGFSFYYGNDADKMIKDITSKGSFYTKYDFMKYKSQFCKPFKISYENYNIYSNPLPSSAITTIKLALRLIFTQDNLIKQSPQELITQANICREILNDKYHNLTKFYNKENEYLTNKTLPLLKAFDAEDTNTTHLCVWDKNNMVVSMTLTLGSHFGSGQLAPGGFFYATELRNYSKSVAQYTSDYPTQAGPLSSKSPIIVILNNNPYLAIGGAGSDRIITNTALFLANSLKDTDIKDYIKEPRFFLDHNNILHIEKPLIENEKNSLKLKEIEKIHPHIKIKPYLHDFFGVISVIQRKSPYEKIRSFGDYHRDSSCLAY